MGRAENDELIAKIKPENPAAKNLIVLFGPYRTVECCPCCAAALPEADTQQVPQQDPDHDGSDAGLSVDRSNSSN